MSERIMPTAKVKASRTMQSDSLANLVTGMGGAGDKSIGSMFVTTLMSREQLEAAYRGDWISRKVIDIPPGDATREWRQWQADAKDITELENSERVLGYQTKLTQAMRRARLYGGAAIVLIVDQGNNQDELKLDKIRKGDLKAMRVLSCNSLNRSEMNRDILSPWFGEPLYYSYTPSNGGQELRFHPSRVIKFIGAPYPDDEGTLTTIGNQTWGDPVLQIVRDSILAAGTVSQSVAALIQDSKLDVLGIPDLTSSLQDPDYERRLKNRFGLASNAKSIFNMILLDKEEEWQRITANFSTMDALLQMYLLMASGAADIPATRLLGQSPAGMNATGESDIAMYDDRIASEQRTILSPATETADEVMIRSTFGTRPDDIFYEWNPLRQMSEKDEADIAFKKAQVFKIDVDSGVLDGAVLKEARQNQLIEDGTYPGIENTIDEFAEPFEEPTPMLLQPGVDPATGLPANNNDPDTVEVAARRRAGNIDTPIDAATVSLYQRIRSARVARRRTPRVRIMRINPTDDRVSVGDARPRSMYVRRDVLNWEEIAAHFKAQGFDATVGSQMHVTLAYSREPVDWMKAGEPWGQNEDGTLVVKPGGVRIVEKFGDAIVLLFVSTDLSWRWCSIKENTGASWEWPDYQPHITITYDKSVGEDVKPYTGKIVLGKEVFEEVNEDYRELVTEDAIAVKLWDAKMPKRKKKK